MILKLAAEDFARCYGLTILDDTFLVEIDHSLIPFELMSKLKEWYSDYYKYTGMTINEISNYSEETNLLDKRGIEILVEIYKSNIFKNIEKYNYFSRGKDEIILELKND